MEKNNNNHVKNYLRENDNWIILAELSFWFSVRGFISDFKLFTWRHYSRIKYETKNIYQNPSKEMIGY